MRTSLSVAVLVLCVLPARAFAYRTFADQLELDSDTAVAWEALPIELELFAQSDDPLDARQANAALDDAIAFWDESACAGGAFEVVGVANAPAASQDGRNTVQWIHEGWQAYGDDDALATTETVYMGVGDRYTLIETDIYLNAATIDWNEQRLATLDGVFAHELGHALGLAHPCELDGRGGAPRCEGSPMTLMHPFYDPADLVLAPDDEAGACFLYAEAEPEPALSDSGASACTFARGRPDGVAFMVACTIALALCLRRRSARVRRRCNATRRHH